MRKGSVIIDIAAATGGNTPFTKNNETVVYNGVSIVGNSSLPSTMPSDASKLYGKNVLNFLQLIIDKEGKMNLNWEDDLVKGSCITHGGEVVHERCERFIVYGLLFLGSLLNNILNNKLLTVLWIVGGNPTGGEVWRGLIMLNWIHLHQEMIYIVILMIFVGIEVIGRVPSVLHTPLMSGANAIHGVVIIGAIIVMGKAEADNYLALILGFSCSDIRNIECGRWICSDRQNAGNV